MSDKLAQGDEIPLRIEVCEQIDEIDALQWNGLVRDSHPFLKHEFLSALERHNCVGPTFGWLPKHLVAWRGEALVAAMPLYLKHNSYGEFVFDHAWADAYQRHGMSYYPKLVSAIPYTPATGERVMTATGLSLDQILPQFYQRAVELTAELGASSLHLLFVTETESRLMGALGMMERLGVQFHWHNREYGSFEDFLASLTAKRRKNIRRERRRVSEAGLHFRVLNGAEVSVDEWRIFSRFYAKTFDERFSLATLNEGFFIEIGRTMGNHVILVLAYEGERCVAASLMYRSNTVLYGRHWGCSHEYDSLHFETCYYQGIEYCIREGLQLFEPGAQGEHKIWRGFLPSFTRSRHWISHMGFREAIGDFLGREGPAIQDYRANLQQSSPYRQ
ncbi:MAG: GNAT family N-acetyltransferase [Chromatiales bacterium]|nr:N-acetyltransferase [Gammaproteobacteria bacterium]